MEPLGELISDRPQLPTSCPGATVGSWYAVRLPPTKHPTHRKNLVFARNRSNLISSRPHEKICNVGSGFRGRLGS